eukprot:c2474_g1_i1 orf=63-263(-)
MLLFSSFSYHHLGQYEACCVSLKSLRVSHVNGQKNTLLMKLTLKTSTLAFQPLTIKLLYAYRNSIG